MKLTKATTATKPFFDDGTLQLSVHYTDHRIRAFVAVYKDTRKEFSVAKHSSVINAFKELEKWLRKQK